MGALPSFLRGMRKLLFSIGGTQLAWAALLARVSREVPRGAAHRERFFNLAGNSQPPRLARARSLFPNPGYALCLLGSRHGASLASRG